MNIEIINTGSELMLGRVLNTHQQWLCRHLADLGYVVGRQTAVPDTAESIRQAVREALSRSELILVTGGLGPTSDDRTREVIAQLVGRPLLEDRAVRESIEHFFATRKRAVPSNSLVQALVPEGTMVLANAFGTAPGLVMEVNPPAAGGKPCLLIMLPGPPRELRPMFSNQVAPLLMRRFPLEAGFVCRTLRTTGLGESFIEEKIDAPLQGLLQGGLELGYCARSGEVDIRLVAQGPKAAEQVAEAERIVRSLVGDLIFGCDDEQLESNLVLMLTERKQTVALAESCTGGFMANRITNVPGASAVFLGGMVTYCNEAKVMFLGVQAATLLQHGAVSEATAKEMAEGARAKWGADYALSATGIAGPSGAVEGKPVGTVFIGLASRSGTIVRRFQNPYDRETFKYVSSQQALEMLRRSLAGISSK